MTSEGGEGGTSQNRSTYQNLIWICGFHKIVKYNCLLPIRNGGTKMISTTRKSIINMSTTYIYRLLCVFWLRLLLLL